MAWINAENKNTLFNILSNEKYLIVYDVETTGLSPVNNRIIELSATRYKIENLQLVEDESMTVYIRQREALPEKIVEITGYTDDFLSSYPFEEEQFYEIENFFENSAVAGYNNISFDDKFMTELYSRYGREFRPCYSVDVLKMARELVNCKSHKLCDVVAEIGVADDLTFHKAYDDIVATARALNYFIKVYQERDNNSSTVELVKPPVTSVSFWEGFKGFSRIYVNTMVGSVYYDIRRKLWFSKDAPMERIDMAFVEQEAWKITNSASEEEFSRFKGEVRV